MHSFHFTRKAVVPFHLPGLGHLGGDRLLYVSVNHNGDWSGDVALTVIAVPPEHADHGAADNWYFQLSTDERARVRVEAAVPAALLLNGDVDPAGLPWLVARVLGAITAQSVMRYVHSRLMNTVESIWLPKERS